MGATGHPGGSTGPPLGSDLLAQLVDEWGRVVRSPTSRVVVRRWAASCEALAGVRTLAEVLDRIDTGDRAQQDAMLGRLLREAGTQSPLAARTVLQAMLPKLARMVRSVRPNHLDGPDRDDRVASLVAAMWETIVTWPASRPAVGVAARLALDTLNRVAPRTQPTASRPRAGHLPHVSLDVSGGGPADGRRRGDQTDRHTGLVPLADAHGRPLERAPRDTTEVHDCLAGELDPEAGLDTLLAWARATGVVEREEAQLLAAYYGLTGTPRAELASSQGLSQPALRKRVSRLCTRLAGRVEGELVCASA